HMIRRHSEMRRAIFEHAEHRLYYRARAADFDTGRVEMAGTRREVLAEELVGSVDEMHTHSGSLAARVVPRQPCRSSARVWTRRGPNGPLAVRSGELELARR